MITVVGSVNLDLVARGPSLPRPGETVTGARLSRFPGGKGANQALAARRLGAEVRLIAAVGNDGMAEEALQLLRAGGVDLSGTQFIAGETTGVALIAVSSEGENQIIVCPGANKALRPHDIGMVTITAMIGVLEVDPAVLLAAANAATGFVSLNLAPALPVPDALLQRAGLISVNETEAAFYGPALHESPALIAISRGADGAELWQGGTLLARARPPEIRVADTTGAGDCFTAALTIALLDGQPPDQALRFAVAAGAAACTRPGAQPGMPSRAEVEALLAQTKG